MTTDITYSTQQDLVTNTGTNPISTTLVNRIYRDSVTRARPTGNGHQDPDHADQQHKIITNLVHNHNMEREGWWRKMSATVALLRHANSIIDQAESKIRAQQERIFMLEDLATADDLTGLKNRRGFFEAFERELDLCNRGKSNGGLLVMIDLDNFKTTNDTHGHLAGDACLRLVGRTLQNEIRAMDTAARMGGDEFILLLSNTTRDDATARAQTIAARLNNLSLAWYGDLIPIRASVGLKNFGAGDQIDLIIRDADARMYQTKAARSRSLSYPVHSTSVPDPANR